MTKSITKDKGQFRSGIIIMTVFTLISGIFLYRSLNPAPASWVRTQATIIDVGVGGSCKVGNPLLTVTYLAGKSQLNSTNYHNNCPITHKVGDTVTIAYNPASPADFVDVQVWPWPLIPLAGVLIGLLAVVFYIRSYARLGRA